jgi:hypothetical protein
MTGESRSHVSGRAIDRRNNGSSAPVEKGHNKEHENRTFIGIRFGARFRVTDLRETSNMDM